VRVGARVSLILAVASAALTACERTAADELNAQNVLPTLESAVGQTYRNTEIVVVDDGAWPQARYGERCDGACDLNILKNSGVTRKTLNRGFRAPVQHCPRLRVSFRSAEPARRVGFDGQT